MSLNEPPLSREIQPGEIQGVLAVTAVKIEMTRRYMALKANETVGLREYVGVKYKSFLTRDLTRDTPFPPDFEKGLNLVTQFKGNGYWTSQRLLKLKSRKRRNMCALCKKKMPETRRLLIAECAAWNALQKTHCGGLAGVVSKSTTRPIEGADRSRAERSNHYRMDIVQPTAT
jgi:hypothetical protein